MVPPALAIFFAIDYLESMETMCAAAQLLRILRMTSKAGFILANEVDGLIDAHLTEPRE